MTDNPITEGDFWYERTIFMKVQSAKRLLKQKIWERWQDEGLQADFDEEIDACFQISDGKEDKEAHLSKGDGIWKGVRCGHLYSHTSYKVRGEQDDF